MQAENVERTTGFEENFAVGKGPLIDPLPNAKGPEVTHLNDKRANRKAICRKFGITMKYLRKQIRLAKRHGISTDHWGC